MKKYSKKEIIIISSFVLLVLVSIIRITFAWFSSEILGNDRASTMTVQMANLKLVYTDTNVIKEENILPGWTMTKTFSVENESNTAVNYNINIIDVTNTFVLDDLVYEITSTNNGGTKVETVMPREDGLLLSASIGVGVTQEYQMNITFKETGSDQNSDQGKLFTGKIQINDTSSQDVGIVAIYVDEELVQSLDEYKNYAMEEYECTNGETIEWDIARTSANIVPITQKTQCTIYLTETTTYLYDAIINKETPMNDASISFSGNSIILEQPSGLYYTADTTYGEDGKRIYYYRGDVDNNWVNLGGYKWRIVRTTSEGGVKLAYSGDASSNSSSFINTSTKFNNLTNPYKTGFNISQSTLTYYLVSYTLNRTNSWGTKVNSTIKDVIDTWYESWIIVNPTVPNYLSGTAKYCNDRSSYTALTDTYAYIHRYPSWSRLIDPTVNHPTFNCNLINNSAYTVENTTGNGFLIYPIALLSADETQYAGLASDGFPSNLDSYILDGATEYNWWTMSPQVSDYDVQSSNQNIYFYSAHVGKIIASSGNIYLLNKGVTAYGYSQYNPAVSVPSNVNVSAAVRPAIALKACVTVVDGDGSKLTPYEISAANC